LNNLKVLAKNDGYVAEISEMVPMDHTLLPLLKEALFIDCLLHQISVNRPTPKLKSDHDKLKANW